MQISQIVSHSNPNYLILFSPLSSIPIPVVTVQRLINSEHHPDKHKHQMKIFDYVIEVKWNVFFAYISSNLDNVEPRKIVELDEKN